MGNDVSVTFESGEVATFRSGRETLGDLQVVYGYGVLRDRANHTYIACRDLRIPSGNYEYIRKRATSSVYTVSATIRGAYNCKGARGNVYKLLEKEKGHFSMAEGRMVSYVDSDLSIKAYFRSYECACDFQTHLNDWEMHKELVNLTAVETQDPIEIVSPGDLRRYLLSNYHPNDFESPCHTLADLKSYHWSVPLTEPVEEGSSLAQYQSLDRNIANLNHIKCHLHDKAKNKKLQNDENNMIAASWPFHQMLDGIATREGVPLLRLSFFSASDHPIATQDNRYAVSLNIEFRDVASAQNYQAPDGAVQRDEVNWTTTVYVKNKTTFKTCLDWKENNTTKLWQAYDAELEAT